MSKSTHYTVRLDGDTNCEYCKKPLKKGVKGVYMVELNCSTGQFSLDPIPEEQSQGFFPVGSGCFKKIQKGIPH